MDGCPSIVLHVCGHARANARTHTHGGPGSEPDEEDGELGPVVVAKMASHAIF